MHADVACDLAEVGGEKLRIFVRGEAAMFPLGYFVFPSLFIAMGKDKEEFLACLTSKYTESGF